MTASISVHSFLEGSDKLMSQVGLACWSTVASVITCPESGQQTMIKSVLTVTSVVILDTHHVDCLLIGQYTFQFCYADICLDKLELTITATVEATLSQTHYTRRM